MMQVPNEIYNTLMRMQGVGDDRAVAVTLGALRALAATPAPVVGEPVAWALMCDARIIGWFREAPDPEAKRQAAEFGESWVPLYTHPAPAPTACAGCGDWCDECNAPQWVVGDGSHECATLSDLHAQLATATADAGRWLDLLKRVPVALNEAFAAGAEEREHGSARLQNKHMATVYALRKDVADALLDAARAGAPGGGEG